MVSNPAATTAFALRLLSTEALSPISKTKGIPNDPRAPAVKNNPVPAPICTLVPWTPKDTLAPAPNAKNNSTIIGMPIGVGK